MASVFNKIGDVKNDVKRNSFDWSHDNNFTTDLGRITPVFTELVPPNSSIRIKPEFGLRFMPMMFPIQTKMKAYLSFYKVPLRTLWKDYMDFISADNTEEYQPPFIKFSGKSFSEGGALSESGLGDYIGMPVSNIDTNWQAMDVGTLIDPTKGATAVFGSATKQGDLPELRFSVMQYVNGPFTPQISYSDNSCYMPVGNDYSFFSPIITFYFTDEMISAGTFRIKWTGSLNIEGTSARQTAEQFVNFTKCSKTPVILTFKKKQTPTPVGDIGLPFDASQKVSFFEPFYVSDTNYRVRFSFEATFNIANFPNMGINKDDPFSLGFTGSIYNIFNLGGKLGSTDVSLTFSYNSSGDSSLVFARPVSGISTPYYSVYNTTDKAIKVSAYPFRAYEAIYNAYIRNTRNNPFVLNGKKTYNRWITTDEGGEDSLTPLDLLYANWQSDAYTTALTAPQQGVAPLVGLTTYETTTVNEAGHTVTIVNTAIVDEDGKAYKVDFESNGEALKGVNYTPLKAGEAINMQSLVSPVTSGISINDFRNVNAYQRYLELNQFRGFSYKEIIEGRFDVNVRYDALNMPEYLGGITRDIIVNPITQTVETTNTGSYVGSLGSQAGLATCFGNSDGSISVFCDEESIVMGIMYVMPMPVYDSILPKWLTYRERLDSFNPEFDHIGYQPIYLKELAAIQAFESGKDLNTVFGYQRPWYEYVQKVDRAHGLFLSSLRNFIMFRSFENAPELGKSFTVMQPGSVNNVFSVTEVSDKILGQIHFDCTAQLPISRVVVPRLE